MILIPKNSNSIMLTYSEGNPSITAKTFTLGGEVQTGTMQISQFHTLKRELISIKNLA